MNSQISTCAVLVCRDLFFTSKITGTADALGYRIQTVGNTEELPQLLKSSDCRCLLLDLESVGLDLTQVLAVLPSDERPTVIAFGPHVRTDLLDAARNSGCDVVLPRSRFSATLPELLKQYLA